MSWKISVGYEDGSEVRISSGKKHCPIGYYEHYWTRSGVKSAVLQYYPKKDNEPIDLLERRTEGWSEE